MKVLVLFTLLISSLIASELNKEQTNYLKCILKGDTKCEITSLKKLVYLAGKEKNWRKYHKYKNTLAEVYKKPVKKHKRVKKVKVTKKTNYTPSTVKNVNVIGDSTKGVKISYIKRKYKLPLPVKKGKISKNFGKYFSKEYNTHLFEESMHIKSKYKTVKSFIKGKIVYIKNEPGYRDTIIIRDNQKVHYVLRNFALNKNYKVNSYLKKNQVIGKIKEDIHISVLKDDKFVNPKRIFKI